MIYPDQVIALQTYFTLSIGLIVVLKKDIVLISLNVQNLRCEAVACDLWHASINVRALPSDLVEAGVHGHKGSYVMLLGVSSNVVEVGV